MNAAKSIHVEGEIGHGALRGHITARLNEVLNRLPMYPVAAHIRFSDVNGPKGGNDIRCAVLVGLPRQSAIRIECQAPTARLAFDASHERLVRRIERSRERWQEERRHPKKYYAANRLLTRSIPVDADDRRSSPRFRAGADEH